MPSVFPPASGSYLGFRTLPWKWIISTKVGLSINRLTWDIVIGLPDHLRLVREAYYNSRFFGYQAAFKPLVHFVSSNCFHGLRSSKGRKFVGT